MTRGCDENRRPESQRAPRRLPSTEPGFWDTRLLGVEDGRELLHRRLESVGKIDVQPLGKYK